MEDLEDYFQRLDARRSESDGERADGESSVACRFCHGCAKDSLASVPSVERFEEADFQQLERKRAEFGIECAICLADVNVGEAVAAAGWSCRRFAMSACMS